jgi:RNA-binding protein YhbY
MVRVNKDELSIELEQTQKEKVLMAQNNDKRKRELITDIKTGLGEEIKKNPGRVKIIKKTRYEKFMIWLRKIFTKF